MSTNTTNMAMGKAVDGDNAKTYVETTLGAALDKIDTHDHSDNGSKGLFPTRLANSVGIGGAAVTTTGLTIASNGLLTTTQIGIDMATWTGSTSATSNIIGIRAIVGTAVGTFTAASGQAVLIASPTLGASSAITTQYGLHVNNQGVAGVTNAYGINIDAQSGASTTNIGLVNNGTTQLLGASAVGANAPVSNQALRVQGSTTDSTADALVVFNSTPTAIFEIRNDQAIGFFAHGPSAKQTVTGSRGANAALASLITALANYGLVTDSSS